VLSPLSPLFVYSCILLTNTFRYPLTKTSKHEPIACIFDVYGWSESNYKNSELEYMLGGNIKSGYTEVATGFKPLKKDNPHFIAKPTINEKVSSLNPFFLPSLPLSSTKTLIILFHRRFTQL
jgi:hypothetical protein